MFNILLLFFEYILVEISFDNDNELVTDVVFNSEKNVFGSLNTIVIGLLIFLIAFPNNIFVC